MFRVHDEAKIKTKSKEPVVRLFYFILGMLLVLLWNIYAKQKMTFKLFIIKLMENKKEVLVNIAGQGTLTSVSSLKRELKYGVLVVIDGLNCVENKNLFQ